MRLTELQTQDSTAQKATKITRHTCSLHRLRWGNWTLTKHNLRFPLSLRGTWLHQHRRRRLVCSVWHSYAASVVFPPFSPLIKKQVVLGIWASKILLRVCQQLVTFRPITVKAMSYRAQRFMARMRYLTLIRMFSYQIS